MRRQIDNLRVAFAPVGGDGWRVLLIRGINVQDAMTGEPVNETSNCGDCGRLHRISGEGWEFEYDAEANNTKCKVFADWAGASWKDVKSAKSDLQMWYNERREIV